MFWPFAVWINCSTVLQWSQKFGNFSAFSLKVQKFYWSLDKFFLTVGQNNFGNKIPFSPCCYFNKFSLIKREAWIDPSCSFLYEPIYDVERMNLVGFDLNAKCLTLNWIGLWFSACSCCLYACSSKNFDFNRKSNSLDNSPTILVEPSWITKN